MISDRVYARRYSPALAHQAVRAGAGHSFDPEVVAAFLSAVVPFPVGAPVRLSGGERGIVTGLPGSPFRPRVLLESGLEVEGQDVAAWQFERVAPRFTAGVPVTVVWAGQSVEGRTFNVSIEGAALIEYSGSIRHGGDVEAVFKPRDAESFRLMGRIVWSRPSGGRGRLMGLWFGPLEAADCKALPSLAGDEATLDTEAEAEPAT